VRFAWFYWCLLVVVREFFCWCFLFVLVWWVLGDGVLLGGLVCCCMRAVIVLGTRPQIIKSAPILREAVGRGFCLDLVHTGQHILIMR